MDKLPADPMKAANDWLAEHRPTLLAMDERRVRFELLTFVVFMDSHVCCFHFFKHFAHLIVLFILAHFWQILNMDETGVVINPPLKKTFTYKEDSSARIKNKGPTKESFSAVFHAYASGDKGKPFVCIHGMHCLFMPPHLSQTAPLFRQQFMYAFVLLDKRHQTKPVDPRCIAVFNGKWMNGETMKIWKLVSTLPLFQY